MLGRLLPGDGKCQVSKGRGAVLDESVEFESAFGELFPRSYRVAARILGEGADAEDAAAEALARAHASWKKVGTLPYRDAWVLRVTANVAVDMARKRHLLPEPSVAPSDEDQTVLRVALVAALSAVTRRQREVVVLRFLEGLPEADVARALGISVGNVKKTTHRAMGKLREHLGAEWQPSLQSAGGGG